MDIIFSHGKESGPFGSKIRRLMEAAQALGCTCYSIDYQGIESPDERVDTLISHLQDADSSDIILVGSSMGGYVSVVAEQSIAIKGMFLMAPALYMESYRHHVFHPARCPVSIVHGWNDTIIPAEHSMKFAALNHCDLHLINGDHRLNSSLPQVEALFTHFLLSTL